MFAVYSPEKNLCIYISEEKLKGKTCMNISHKPQSSCIVNNYLVYLEFPY